MEEAVKEVVDFYRVYHSMRYVRGELVFRLHSRLSDTVMAKLSVEFADILKDGGFEQCEALPAELNEPELAEFPRLKFRFNRHALGRLRMLIDFINREG